MKSQYSHRGASKMLPPMSRFPPKEAGRVVSRLPLVSIPVGGRAVAPGGNGRHIHARIAGARASFGGAAASRGNTGGPSANWND